MPDKRGASKAPGSLSAKKGRPRAGGPGPRKAAGPARPQESRQARSGRAGRADVPVVGIGASAGGLEALREFFTQMPAGSGLAFVVIQHLDPHHESLMVDLLGRCTPMAVEQAAEGLAIEAGHVYVIPPNTSLTVKAGVLHLAEPVARRGVRMPIDAFFRSLAADQGPRSICIILSGTASEGTLGLREIKAQGGMAMVQDPETAQHDGMPRNAIATGLVDYVLPAGEMPETLLRYVGHSYFREGARVGEAPPAADELVNIVSLLRTRVGHDFRTYKRSTLVRRIHRRMGLHEVETMRDYLDILRGNPGEVHALFRDLLVKVTSFFREPQAWEVLAELVVPEIVHGAGDGGEVRAWVPACSTGMEAYSLAMLFAEEIDRLEWRCTVQIFATDVDREALDVARLGVYSADVAADVSPERLQRFFASQGPHFQVSQRLRDMVVFAPQDLLGDPPFSRLDLVSCRNLLIYIDPDVQQKLLSLFRFALRDGGFLFLGSSESLGPSEAGFSTISKKWRIFRSAGGRRGAAPALPPLLGRSSAAPAAILDSRRGPGVGELANRVLADRFAPAAVIVDHRYQVVYFHGEVGRYLLHPVGEPTRELLALLREPIRGRVRGAVYHAISKGGPAVVQSVLPDAGGPRPLKVSAQPLAEERDGQRLILVTFEELEQKAGPEPFSVSPGDEEVVRELELELKSTREELQSTIEELETSNEELKASNEEVMSINEELQSSNEELEASKEELQSINEELSTVNSQLHEKVFELEGVNNDLANLLSSTAVATVFLDRELRIRRFTPITTKLLNVIPGDVGRPLSDIASELNDATLGADARQVLDRLTPIEREIGIEDGRWFIRRVLPFRTSNDRIDGVVITFIEVTDLKRTEAEHSRLAAIVDTSSDAIISKDPDGTVKTWNKGAEAMYGFTAHEMVGRSIEQIVLETGRLQNRRALARVARGETIRVEEQRRRKDGTLIGVEILLAPIVNSVGTIVGVSSIARDVTEARRVQRELAESEARLRATGDLVPFGIWMCNTAGECTFVTKPYLKATGRTFDELRGFRWLELVPEDEREALAEAWEQSVRTGEDWDYEYSFRGADGRLLRTATKGRAVRDKAGGIAYWAGFHLDVTELYRLQQELIALNASLEERVKGRTAQLQALAVELARTEERVRTELARTLHDGLQQLLAAAHLHAEAALAAHDAAQAKEQVEKLGVLLDKAMEASQRMVAELAPPALQRAGVRSALDWLAKDLQDRLRVELKVAGDAGALSGLSTRQRRFVFRAVRELLINTIKHAGAATARVTLAVSGGILEVMVEDEGDGFDPAVLDRDIPETFGLLSVREQTGAMGGAMTVESAPGKGTRIRLVFPMEEEETAALAPEAAASPGRRGGEKAGPARPGGPVRVLLVDDDRPFRESLATRLGAEEGIVVAGQAEDGEAALARVRELDPEVVVMDVEMPGMDGVQATRILKTATPVLTVFALSMHDDAATRGAMTAAGASACFGKGSDAKPLVEAILAVRSRG